MWKRLAPCPLEQQGRENYQRPLACQNEKRPFCREICRGGLNGVVFGEYGHLKFRQTSKPAAMKSGLLPLLAAAALALVPSQAPADTDITFQDFYDALTPHGDWVELDDYGYCWRPFVDDHWRPYTDGQWVYTEAGYTWFSNEPWGWATYHYGRWTKLQNWGWVWVPGYEWGPAWVSWRTSDDYIGWAALPPEAVWEDSIGFGAYVDVDYGIGPDWYAFCPVTYFGAPRLRTVCLPWRSNITIINLTVNITRIRHVNNIIINDGPDITVINRRAHTPIRRVRLERETSLDVTALRQGRVKSRLEGDTLKIPSPRVEKQDARPVKIAGRASRGQINRGWEGAGLNPALAAEYREKIQGDARRANRPVSTAVAPPNLDPPPATPQPNTRRNSEVGRSDGRPPAATPAMREPPREPQVLPRDQPAVGQQTNREEELRARILKQRQEEERDARQADLSRQQEQAQQQQQALRQQQQGEETARQQRAAELREKAARAQQEVEARRETARQNQQEAARQQQENQRQQQSLQQQLQQQRQQFQQNRQERRQAP